MNRYFRLENRQALLPLLLLATGLALAGCGEGEEKPATTSTSSVASSGAASGSATSTSTTATQTPVATTPTTTPPVIVPPTTGTSTNRAPTISGTPLAAINVATAYTFTPAAADADGDTLGFSIANKPTWASFSTTTGRLSGTPTLAQVGTYANIVITVSDGKTTKALSAFSIAVTQVSTGSAALSWMPPTENTDGSALTNLSGYKIYYGTSAGALNQTITVNNAGLVNYVVENLSPATWYFAVKAVANGVESDLSNVASKTIS